MGMDDRDTDAPRKRPRLSPPPAHINGAPGASGGAASLPPLSLSILGVEPLDEFVREIADFVQHMIATRPEHLRAPEHVVEVEAKIGVLRDRASGQRAALPVLTETILAPNSIDCRFESNMTAAQHKHFNTLLNKLKVEPPNPASPVSYKHLHVIDSFYPPDASSGQREKIRVTRDEKTGSVLECMHKIRLGDLNVYSPKRAADWRVSVSVEVPVPHPTGSPTHSRRKDRMSYSHEEFNIDLTQVTSSTPNGPSEVLHELEIEIARPTLLLSAAARRGDPAASPTEREAFDELIRAFVNNARILLRNANDGWQ